MGNAGLILSMKGTKMEQRQYWTADISVPEMTDLFPYLYQEHQEPQYHKDTGLNTPHRSS